jgi:hypothetical protein
MSRSNGAALGAFLLAVMLLLAGVTLAKDGFYIARHEGDTLHLTQMVLRMASGEWPHLDFQTPIGVLAMAPIALFVKLGWGIGHSLLLSQVLVAVVALPAIWWVAVSRFTPLWGAVFGGFSLVVILALVHGETDFTVYFSMHYNRWAWALSFLAIALAVLPAQGPKSAVADGVVIGLTLAALVLIKVTYAVAFLPPILVALVALRAWRTIWVGALAGLALAAVITLAVGTPMFWLAYLRDLATVAGSDVRPQPGLGWPAILSAPAFLGGNLVAVGAVILLRHAGQMRAGLVLLLLLPGFAYVTYQNFGNDPQWIGLVGLMLVMLEPAREIRNAMGWNVTKGIGLAAVACFAFAAPSALNLIYSPFRHLKVDTAEYTPILPGSGVHEDLYTLALWTRRVDGMVALDGPDSAFAAYTDPQARDDISTGFRGETLPVCAIDVGMVAWFRAISDDLKASGLADGTSAFVADILSSYWLYGAFEPLKHGAPWYYGGLPGFGNADYLLVPLCPLSPRVRKQVLEAVDAAGVDLDEVRRTETYILFAIR